MRYTSLYWGFWSAVTVIKPLELKIGKAVIPAKGNVYITFGFSMPLPFRVTTITITHSRNEYIWSHPKAEITAEQEWCTGVYYAARQCFLITDLLHKRFKNWCWTDYPASVQIRLLLLYACYTSVCMFVFTMCRNEIIIRDTKMDRETEEWARPIIPHCNTHSLTMHKMGLTWSHGITLKACHPYCYCLSFC